MSSSSADDFLSRYISMFDRPAIDYYAALGFKTETDGPLAEIQVEEIERRANNIWRTHRPDMAKTEEIDIALVNKAYKELTNQFTRMMYDVAMGHTKKSEEVLLRINRVKSSLSSAYNLSLVEKYKSLVAEEQAFTQKGERGLVIIDAKYGREHDRDIDEFKGVPPYNDVKFAVQCMAVNGQIQSEYTYSLFAYDGFSLPFDESRSSLVLDPTLVVYYKCGPHIHKATFQDHEQIIIPQQGHLLSESECLAYELSVFASSPAERAARRRRRQARWLTFTALATAAAAVAAAALYFNFGKKQGDKSPNQAIL